MSILWQIEFYKGKSDFNCKAIIIAAWIWGREELSILNFDPAYSYFEGTKISYQICINEGYKKPPYNCLILLTSNIILDYHFEQVTLSILNLNVLVKQFINCYIFSSINGTNWLLNKGICQGVNQKCWQDQVFEEFEKINQAEVISMRLKAHKMQVGSVGFFFFKVFRLEKISMTAICRTFSIC